jgi:hypothetical protein
MGRIGMAFKAFFGILFNRAVADRAASLFEDEALPKVTTSEPATKPEKAAAKPIRSDALTLLETLQREARLVDLCQDSLDAYSDEQIGAAARNVLRDSGQVLQRLFALTPVAGEGEQLDVPDGFDPARYRLTGNVARPPYRGRVTHGGWQATRCDLPQWSGVKESALIVAPAEVEIA